MLKKFGTVLLLITIAILATYLLNRLGALRGIEHLVLNEEQALAPHKSERIEVVNITDADYDDYFGGQSPLNPPKLFELLKAINKSNPALIAVDIDTSHPQFSKQYSQIDDNLSDKLIWERDLSLSSESSTAPEPLDVLGGSDPSLNKYSGVPELLDDAEDRVTRFYARCVATSAGLKPSFVYAVVTAYRARQRNLRPEGMPECPRGVEEPTRPFLISYPLRPDSSLVFRDAGQVLGLSGKSNIHGTAAGIFPEFQGKIVLVGGTYRDFDRHYTPIGTLPGVAVLANAIETELQGDSPKAYPPVVLFLVEFVSGLFLFAILSLVRRLLTAIAIGLVLVVGMPLAVSFVFYRTPSRFAIFLPTLIAVLAFEVLEHVRHHSLESALGAGTDYRR